jgi:PIN domain nuclease of toxin-antitoxin system
MRLLLDTVTLLLAVQSSHRISLRAMSELQNPSNVREISVVSLAEIALKNAIGKLTFTEPDVRKAIEDLHLKLLPCTEDHAVRLFDLPLLHRDPFDRQIIAQAISENVPVVTCDRHFRLYKTVKVIW